MGEQLSDRVKQARQQQKRRTTGDGASAFIDAATAGEPRQDDTPRRLARKHIEGELNKLRPAFEAALPKNYTVDQLVRDALQEIWRNRVDWYDEHVDVTSLLAAVMTSAQLGLRLGVLGQAYILPIWNKELGCREAVWVAGYRGLAKLAHQSGRIRGLTARTVWEHDTFRLVYREDRDELRHEPAPTPDRGAPVRYYARALLPDNGYQLTDPAWHTDMLAFRDRRVKVTTGPWYEETGQPGCGFETMAWKTMVKRLSKLLPLDMRFGQAIGADEGVRRDLSPKANPEHVTEPTTIQGEWTEGPPAEDLWAGTDARPPRQRQEGAT